MKTETFTIRLYLFDYRGTLATHPVLKLYWRTKVDKLDVPGEITKCRTTALLAEIKGDCRGYHVVVGAN